MKSLEGKVVVVRAQRSSDVIVVGVWSGVEEGFLKVKHAVSVVRYRDQIGVAGLTRGPGNHTFKPGPEQGTCFLPIQNVLDVWEADPGAWDAVLPGLGR